MRLEFHRPGWELSILLEERSRPLPVLDRMSGLPLGLPAELWPTCDECKQPMAFVGQFGHAERRISIAVPGAAPSGPGVAYAFLCDNPLTSLKCHMWQLEPLQRVNGRVIVCQPESIAAFTEPPSALPTLPPLGMLATAWRVGADEVPDDHVEILRYGFHKTRDAYPGSEPQPAPAMTPAEKEAAYEAEWHSGRTKIGGKPTWLQDPRFQNDPDRPFRYVYEAQWSCYEVTSGRIFEQPWVDTDRERARAATTRYFDSQVKIAGWPFNLRTFANPDAVNIDDTGFYRRKDGTAKLNTHESGCLYLLRDTLTAGFELFYIGR